MVESVYKVIELVGTSTESWEKAAAAAFAEVRKRLIPYDSTSPSPRLGRYGATDGREYQQYFLADDNHTETGCPFARLAQNKTPTAKDREQAA